MRVVPEDYGHYATGRKPREGEDAGLWEPNYYGPRGFAKGRMGDRPRIDPEAVRQAQPGEAWVIQAGQSIHLRVLPPPTAPSLPIEPAATIPLTDDTMASRSSSRRRSGSPPPSLSPVGRCGGAASGSPAAATGSGGCPRRPAGPGCPCRPYRDGDEVPSREPRDEASAPPPAERPHGQHHRAHQDHQNKHNPNRFQRWHQRDPSPDGQSSAGCCHSGQGGASRRCPMCRQQRRRQR
jgi:hypothetical protein